jgi:hypothetical protein
VCDKLAMPGPVCTVERDIHCRMPYDGSVMVQGNNPFVMSTNRSLCNIIDLEMHIIAIYRSELPADHCYNIRCIKQVKKMGA